MFAWPPRRSPNSHRDGAALAAAMAPPQERCCILFWHQWGLEARRYQVVLEMLRCLCSLTSSLLFDAFTG
eukprot:5590426-Pyramimonas_sp.AAC.1